MARSKHQRNKHRVRQDDFIEQDSPLLDLPREIRDLIYHFALTKPTPIDLWPQKFLVGDEQRNIPRLWQRLEKKGPPNPSYWVRHQQDLEYVRKEMAVNILATCMQIYDEAWPHLY